jgi:tartrate-resistant acid phosphatase type 5
VETSWNHTRRPIDARITRHEFLKQISAFSALSVAGPVLWADEGIPLDPAAHHILMLGDWGTAGHSKQQRVVAQAMRQWTETTQIHPDALFMLGDNWYGELAGGVASPRWSKQFEDMYPASYFPGPAYAVLGNHDYERHHFDKVAAQLQYAQTRQTRWTLPARWYTFQYPQNHPIVTFICLDSNLPETKHLDFLPGSFLMSREDQQQQDAWLRKELAKPRKTPFVAVVAHHPLYSNGKHGDNPVLIAQWDALLRDHKVDLYISGHDHDLQHLEFAGHPTSFVISGAGGAELVGWSRPPASRKQWGDRALGFTVLEVIPQAVTVRHIDQNARTIYLFRKTAFSSE